MDGGLFGGGLARHHRVKWFLQPPPEHAKFRRCRRGPSAAPLCRRSIEHFLLLPRAHAVGHAFIEVRRPDDSLYAPEPHSLSYLVAYTGKGEGDTLALQLLDVGQ